jgi:hypothetical protein
MSPEEKQLLHLIALRPKWQYRELLDRSELWHKGLLPSRIEALRSAGLIDETGEVIEVTARGLEVAKAGL